MLAGQIWEMWLIDLRGKRVLRCLLSVLAGCHRQGQSLSCRLKDQLQDFSFSVIQVFKAFWSVTGGT